MSNVLVPQDVLTKTFSQLTDWEKQALRVMYVSVDSPRFGVGMYIGDNDDIKIRFVASTTGNPLDQTIDKTNSVEFTSVNTIPLNMFNVASSLVSRATAFISEDRSLQTLYPNNPSIAPYVMFKE